MTKQHISEGLKIFIREKIQTVLRLEVLLLLHYQQFRSFTVAEVANELNLEKEAARDQLTALEAVGVVQSNGDKPRYRYDPVNASLRSMVEQLAVGYSRQRVSILSAILSKHSERTRLFAEAFQIIRRND
jgi:DNA-binding IclR family transcriptional regulator